MKYNVLITGGAGFIGSRLALALVSSGHTVRILDSLSPQVHGDNPSNSYFLSILNSNFDFIRGSVTSRNDLLRALAGIDIVVHLAAETGTGQSMYAIEHYTNINVVGTSLLLEVIANNQLSIKKIIVASSRAVYGEGKYCCIEHGVVFPSPRTASNMAVGDFSVHCPICGIEVDAVPSDEDTPVRPSSVYGITKLAQEQMVLTIGKALGISVVAFRYQNVYGPGQSLSNPYTGILSIFSTRIRNGNGINIFEDGKESRDFVYIDDVISVTARAVEYDEPIVDVFNVGSGVSTDVYTIAQTLQKLLSGSAPIQISGQFRVGDIRHNIADLAKVKKIFGFVPTMGIEKGLFEFVNWVKSEKIQTDRYEESLQELKSKGMFQ